MKKHLFLKILPGWIYLYTVDWIIPSTALFHSVELQKANPAWNSVSALSHPVCRGCHKTQLFATDQSFNTRSPAEAQETHILLGKLKTPGAAPADTHISWQELQINPPSKTWITLVLFDGDTEERPWHERSWGEGLKSPTASNSRHGAPWRTAQASSKDNSSQRRPFPTLSAIICTAQCSGVIYPHLCLPLIRDT